MIKWAKITLLRESNTIHSNKSIERQGTISQDVFNDKSTRIDLSPTSSVIHKFNFQKLIRVVYNSVLTSTVGESIINMQDNQGKTVLHYACQKQNKQMVRMLLDYGAWVGAKDNQDKEPLAYWTTEIIKSMVIVEQENIEKLEGDMDRISQYLAGK